jgi:hypothetical protein
MFPDFPTKTLHFENREEFNKACDDYKHHPLLIDIGYSDMLLMFEVDFEIPQELIHMNIES